MDTTHPDPLLAHALEALRAQGPMVRVVARAPRIGQKRPGAVIEIRNGQHAKLYAAEVKHNVQDATIGAVLLQRTGAKHPPLLVAEYVPPAIADKLKENNLSFIDAAGNAYIKQTDLFIWVKGNRRRMPAAAGFEKRYVARAFEPAGLRVLFAFLCDPALVDRPFREIAEKADVAHGTVGEVMAELPHGNYVYDFGTTAGGRKLRNVEDLLAKWAEAYARKLKPKLLLGRYTARNVGWWKKVDPTKFDMVLGAEPAAAKITRHLRPAVITFYGDRAEPRLILDNALRTDPKGDVEIAKRFWRVQTDEDKKGLAPLPLIYADLIATGDPRCIETAGLIRDRYLARLERKA
jgi:hypothetical protein